MSQITEEEGARFEKPFDLSPGRFIKRRFYDTNGVVDIGYGMNDSLTIEFHNLKIVKKIGLAALTRELESAGTAYFLKQYDRGDGGMIIKPPLEAAA